LVSRKSAGPYRPAAEAQVVAKEAPKPTIAEEKPVAVVTPPPAAQPQLASTHVERVESKPVIEKKETPEPPKQEPAPDPEPVYAAPEPATKARRVGEFSDVEVGTLRKKSREFRKLHDQLKTCKTRSIRYASKKIDCTNLESRVSAMLNETYGID
jgi:hypothetical protein